LIFNILAFFAVGSEPERHQNSTRSRTRSNGQGWASLRNVVTALQKSNYFLFKTITSYKNIGSRPLKSSIGRYKINLEALKSCKVCKDIMVFIRCKLPVLCKSLKSVQLIHQILMCSTVLQYMLIVIQPLHYNPSKTSQFRKRKAITLKLYKKGLKVIAL
jgi:hypothetical protein